MQADGGEDQCSIKISVQWGFAVSWHDNLLFKCTTALLPPPWSTADSSYIIIECLFSFPSPSFSVSHLLTPPHCSPPPSLTRVSQCENLIMFYCWTCKLNWTASCSLSLSQCFMNCVFVLVLIMYVWFYVHFCSVAKESKRAWSIWQFLGAVGKLIDWLLNYSRYNLW